MSILISSLYVGTNEEYVGTSSCCIKTAIGLPVGRSNIVVINWHKMLASRQLFLITAVIARSVLSFVSWLGVDYVCYLFKFKDDVSETQLFCLFICVRCCWFELAFIK